MSRKMNRNFIVRLEGCGYHGYVGYRGLVEACGEELADKAICGAISSNMYKFTRKLRRGLRIDFYSK